MADHLKTPDITYKGVKDYRLITPYMRFGFIDFQRTQIFSILIMKKPAYRPSHHTLIMMIF